MKTQLQRPFNRGFTLIELMVAMAITTIIVTVLVSVTSMALDTWNRSRSELRAAKQAKAALDYVARDFDSMVTRSGGAVEWLSALAPTTLPGDAGKLSSNAAELIFYTVAGDRYNGQLGATGTDKPGDVSCVAYQLQFDDPITPGSTFKTFSLKRLLVDPDKTYADFLGKTILSTALTPYQTQLNGSDYLISENIYQFTITFHVQVIKVVGTTSTVLNVPVKIGPAESAMSTKDFRITGAGLTTTWLGSTTPAVTSAELKSGRVRAIEISLTVLSDLGVDRLRTATFTPAQLADFLSKNSYQFSKLVQVPGA